MLNFIVCTLQSSSLENLPSALYQFTSICPSSRASVSLSPFFMTFPVQPCPFWNGDQHYVCVKEQYNHVFLCSFPLNSSMFWHQCGSLFIYLHAFLFNMAKNGLLTKSSFITCYGHRTSGQSTVFPSPTRIVQKKKKSQNDRLGRKN